MINLEILPNIASFNVAMPNNERISFVFPDAPVKSEIGFTEDAVTFKCSNTSFVTAHKQDDTIHVIFSQEEAFPTQIVTVLSGQIKKTSDDEITVESGDCKLKINVFDGTFLISGSSITWTFSATMRMEIKEEDETNEQNASMLTLSSLVIPAGKRGPQFSIDIGDNVSDIKTVPVNFSTISNNPPKYYFEKPRPIRLGLPIISTVASPDLNTGVSGTRSLSENEKNTLINGAGWASKNIVFLIQSTYAININNHNLYLMLALPNGMDTLASPVKILMTPYSPVGNLATAWTANYVFHQEDTVNYVDGISYIGVYTDMKFTHSLALGVDVGTSSLGEGNNLYPGY